MSGLHRADGDSGGPTRLGVVERVAAVMDTFIDGPEWMGLAEISLLADIPRSTTSRILRQLVVLQWLHHGDRGYSLGARVRRYGSRVAGCEDLRAAANAALNDLSLATRGVAHLAVLEGSAVHYLDKVGGAASASIPSRIGVRLPATDTVSGQALLACLDPERVDALFGAAGGIDRIHRALQRVRCRRGVAFQPADRCKLGITAIAAPVSVPAGPPAAVSLCIRRPVELEQLAPLVLRAAHRTARALSAAHHFVPS